MMSSSFEVIEKKVEELVSLAEKLGSLARSLIVGVQKKEDHGASAEVEVPFEHHEEEQQTAPIAEVPVAGVSVESNGQVTSEVKKPSQSELIRQFLKTHHGVRNKDVIEAIKRDHGVEVNASLVSYIRNSSAQKKSAPKVVRMKIQHPISRDKGKTTAVRSGSSMIREYLEKYPDASNDEVVKEIKRSKKVSVRPTLVSSVRAFLKRAGGKTSSVSSKTRKGLPMTALVVRILEKAPKEGVKLSALSKKAIDFGYEYRGSKGAEGVTQNVYQALHALSRQIPHRGYEGKAPVVLHDGMRWKLNPKAKKKIA